MAIFYGGSDSLVEFEVLSADLPELAFVKEIAEWEHLGRWLFFFLLALFLFFYLFLEEV